MPELNAIHIALLAAAALLGIVVGWRFRGIRARQEKAAVNAGWQEQIEAQRTEHDRLTLQNKGLMEQIGQYQASNKDAKNRAKELAEAIQEAYVRRDELHREIKAIRGNLDVTTTERDKLQSDVAKQSGNRATAEAQKAKIERLTVELNNWQDRVPPLIERYRLRNAEAEQLETDLAAARQLITELETNRDSVETRIEPVTHPGALTNGRDASNDTIEETSDLFVDSTDLSDDARDDLQRIKGIGPAIERTLNDMGIFRFHQIAELSEYDIDRVANRLKGFHSRIYREDWIGQARDLHDQSIDG